MKKKLKKKKENSTKRGYQCSGVSFNIQLLELAREKCGKDDRTISYYINRLLAADLGVDFQSLKVA